MNNALAHRLPDQWVEGERSSNRYIKGCIAKESGIDILVARLTFGQIQIRL